MMKNPQKISLLYHQSVVRVSREAFISWRLEEIQKSLLEEALMQSKKRALRDDISRV